MGTRREQRVEMSLPVRIWGMDRAGKLFDQQATTVDITPIGACLSGVSCELQIGSVIGVQHGTSKSRFRVAWIGESGTHRDSQIGIITVEPGKYIWGVALARQLGDFFRSEAATAPELEAPLLAQSFRPALESPTSMQVHQERLRHRGVRRRK